MKPKFFRPVLLELAQTLYDIFENGAYTDQQVERTFKRHPKWGARDRRFFAESVYEVVRHCRRLAFLAGAQEQGPRDRGYYLKLWGVYAYERWQDSQILGVDFDLSIYQSQLKLLADQPLAIQASWDQALEAEISGQMGAMWPSIIQDLNHVAPVDLRINTLKSDLRTVQLGLLQEGVESEPLPSPLVGLALKERKNIFQSPIFKQGAIEVQDRASQYISYFVDPQPGEQVADACAGGGGKSLDMAQRMKNKGRIVAMDIHAWKLDELRTRAKRNGVSIIETKPIETTKVIKRQEGRFDRVLLDVPCSGSGVIRRSPDTKYKLSPARVRELESTQQNILALYSRLVKPGGYLIYATCSLLPSENEHQVDWFLKQSPPDEWVLVEQWQNRFDPEKGDGFYAAKLQRKK